MNRRQFLRFNVLGLAGTSFAFAAGENHMRSGHGMHGMTNANMDTQNMNIDISHVKIADPNTKLLDKSAFKSGETLKPLQILKNESQDKNFFRATIKIAESSIEIAKGKKTNFYTYNGLIPGPKIEVYEGDTVEILVKNDLKEPTTIHWHGAPVPSNQDGNPHDPIMPGMERIYRFNLPQGSAGTYWYHPHPHHLTGRQVAKGLAGTFVVKAKNDPLSHLKEQDLVISDLRIDENGEIPYNSVTDWLNGREGEIVLVNGQLEPKITIDDAQRIRIYNFCSARYLNLHIDDAEFILVGTDGGLLEEPRVLKELFLSPASRVEVVIKTNKLGKFKLESLYYDRNKMMVRDTRENIFLADVFIEKTIKELPQTLRKFKPLQEPKAFKKVVMSENHMKMMSGMSSRNIDDLKTSLASMFLLNGEVFDLNKVNLHSKVGEVEDWIIINDSHMDHPFHIHGTQFELISSNFRGEHKNAEFRSLRDTINVRPGEEVRIRMSQEFAGERMYHCHILEHEDLGMMGILKVE